MRYRHVKGYEFMAGGHSAMVGEQAGKFDILVVTNLCSGPPRTGAEVRSWYSVRSLQSLGQVTVLSLAGSAVVGHEESAWKGGYVRAADNTPLKMGDKRTRLTAWQSILAVVLMPWRENWTLWMQHLVQYAGEQRNVGESERRVLLRRLFHFQHAVFSRLGCLNPCLCSGLIQVWLQMKERFLANEGKHAFDILWVENTICWPVAEQLLRGLSRRPRAIVLNGQNIEYKVLQQAVNTSSCSLKRVFLDREAKQMRRLEERAFAASDLVIQCSDGDVAEAKRLIPRLKGWVFPNGVDVKVFVEQEEKLQASVPTVLFPASFQYGPNIDGAQFLACEVWPRVLTMLPDARLILAGHEAATLQRSSWLKCKSIELISSPVDMKPILGRSWIVAVPLLSGGGTRLKILEAMSSGRAVVSTSLGAEGVPYEVGRHLLLADDAGEFAEAIVRLLKDEKLRRRLKEQARDFVKQKYDWEYLGTLLEQRVRLLLTEVKGP
ncbi:MAG: glycosyltransferase family 4 protein [Planctomycetia bacterium]